MKKDVERVLCMPLSDRQYEMLLKDWNAFTNEPDKYSNYSDMVEEYLRNQPKDKLEILQETLNVNLTDENLDYIKEYWKAFYNDPAMFMDDVVCDMVLQDLGLTPYEKKEKKKTKTEERKMDMEISLLGVPGLEVKHYTPCDTLAWGKLGGCPVYVRKVDRAAIIPYYDGRPESISELTSLVKEDGYVAIVFQSEVDYVIYVMYSDGIGTIGNVSINSICPSSYQYAGIVKLGDGVEEQSEDRMKFTKMVYVPFNNGSNGSLIPIMWAITGTGDGLNGCVTITAEEYESIISDGVVSIDSANSIFTRIKTALPAIELESSPKGARYSCVKVEHDGIVSMYAYNRNHVAYNGNTDSLRAIMSVLLERLCGVFPNIVRCNLGRYINNAIDRDDLVIAFAGSDAPTDEVAGNISVGNTNAGVKKEEESRNFSDNPLIRAAQRGDTRYK